MIFTKVGFQNILKSNYSSHRRRVWRYQRGNQNSYIEEEQTTQWPKEKIQKDKQRSTKHTHKTKGRVTRTLLKNWGELRCFGRESSSCSSSGTRQNSVKNEIVTFKLIMWEMWLYWFCMSALHVLFILNGLTGHVGPLEWPSEFWKETYKDHCSKVYFMAK